MGDGSWMVEACCCVLPIPIGIVGLLLLAARPRRR
jgi:hypothetical protein